MKLNRVLLALLLICSLSLTLPACRGEADDLFAPFRSAYTAEIEGETNGVSFAARLAAAPLSGDGTRSVTLTFYAPEALSGTTLTKQSNGEISLSAGSILLDSVSAEGFSAFFSLFPTEGEVEEIALTAEGHTLVKGADFTLELLEDGTPCRAANATINATIVFFG